MLFRNSDNSHARNNLESSGFKNISRNNFYDQKNVNGNFKNYNARFSFGSGRPQAPPQSRTCYKCRKLGHLAKVCRAMLSNMVGMVYLIKNKNLCLCRLLIKVKFHKRKLPL